jgi:RimJ/RimL family protein N-acetyltransferase
VTVLLTTERLILRDWTPEDARRALAVYGNHEVTRWMTPVLNQIGDLGSMRSTLEQWISEQGETAPGTGRWAIEDRETGTVVGGITLRSLPVPEDDIEFAWQLDPRYWGNGYATEAGRALAEWAFERDLEELFAVVRPPNTRAAAAAKRIGMQWVGETDKYYGLHLDVYRLRIADLRDAT